MMQPSRFQSIPRILNSRRSLGDVSAQGPQLLDGRTFVQLPFGALLRAPSTLGDIMLQLTCITSGNRLK